MSRVAPRPRAPRDASSPPPRRAPPSSPPPRPAAQARPPPPCAWSSSPPPRRHPPRRPDDAPRPGPEFEDVAFPRYPGFTTFPRASRRATCGSRRPRGGPRPPGPPEWAAWTVHRGRKFPGPLGTTAPCSSPGTRPVPTLEEAVFAGRRAASGASAPKARQLPLRAPRAPPGRHPPAPRTKLGRAPSEARPRARDERVDRASARAPADPADRDWLESVIDRNAFTIKPADRSLLFDVRVLAAGRSTTTPGPPTPIF